MTTTQRPLLNPLCPYGMFLRILQTMALCRILIPTTTDNNTRTINDITIKESAKAKTEAPRPFPKHTGCNIYTCFQKCSELSAIVKNIKKALDLYFMHIMTKVKARKVISYFRTLKKQEKKYWQCLYKLANGRKQLLLLYKTALNFRQGINTCK